jgi:hypothetical protein
VDALRDLGVVDVGDVLMLAGEIEPALARLERAVHTVAAAGAIPVVLGGDHTIALPDVTGVARHHGWGGCRWSTSTPTPTPATPSSAACSATAPRCGG